MNDIDRARAKLLIGEISQHLSALRSDAAGYAELRGEVDALKAMLDRDDAPPALVRGRMTSLHGMLAGASQELRADGIRAGQFLSELGRMLGLD